MRSLLKGNRRYLVLIPVVFLLLNAYYFRHASEQIQDLIMNEKRVEVENHVKILTAAINEDTSRSGINNEQNIIKAAEYLNSLPMTFAGAYKQENGKLKIISERNEDIMFDPLRYSEFFRMIADHDSGSLKLPFRMDGEKEQTWYVYYQHMPMFEPRENRYLVATAISGQSVVSSIPIWESAGQWASTILTFLLNIVLVVKFTKRRHRKGGSKNEAAV